MGNYALTETGETVYPYNFSRNNRPSNLSCPGCGCPVLWVAGKEGVQESYFRHEKNSEAKDIGCMFYQATETEIHREGSIVQLYKETGNKYWGMPVTLPKESAWHQAWKREFYPSDRERVVKSPKFEEADTHRADVLLGNLVLEFQHTSLSESEYWERTNDWLRAGYEVLWVLDQTRYSEAEGDTIFLSEYHNHHLCSFLQAGGIDRRAGGTGVVMEFLAFDIGGYVYLLSGISLSKSDIVYAKEVYKMNRKEFIAWVNHRSRTKSVPRNTSESAPPSVQIISALTNENLWKYYAYEVYVSKDGKCWVNYMRRVPSGLKFHKKYGEPPYRAECTAKQMEKLDVLMARNGFAEIELVDPDANYLKVARIIG